MPMFSSSNNGLWNVRPDIAELNVEHRDDSGDFLAAALGFGVRDGDQGLRREERAHLLEADNAGGQPGAGVGEHISAMEGVRFVRARAAIDAFIDLPQPLDAVALGDQRQQAIVRGRRNNVRCGSSRPRTAAAVPTPGSTTATNTVPLGQNCSV